MIFGVLYVDTSRKFRKIPDFGQKVFLQIFENFESISTEVGSPPCKNTSDRYPSQNITISISLPRSLEDSKGFLDNFDSLHIYQVFFGNSPPKIRFHVFG